MITEHDGSITAVIRHQTKGTSRAGRRGRGGEEGEDGPRHSRSITGSLDEVSAPEHGGERSLRVQPHSSARLQRGRIQVEFGEGRLLILREHVVVRFSVSRWFYIVVFLPPRPFIDLKA